jgi:DTW domain-containing protein YfiP
MHMLLSAAVAILALSQEFISATPVGSSTLVKRVLPESDYAKIEDFTVEKFTKDMTSQPEKDKCLFYTRRTAPEQKESLSKTAQCYAKENGLTTIWVCTIILTFWMR